MRYRDFDDFLAESSEEPITFTVKGKQYSVPGSLPARTALEIIRLQAESADQPVANAKLLEIMASILGEKTLEELANELSFSQLSEVMRWLLEQYGQTEQTTEDDQGNA